jgi:hypothetical protein
MIWPSVSRNTSATWYRHGFIAICFRTSPPRRRPVYALSENSQVFPSFAWSSFSEEGGAGATLLPGDAVVCSARIADDPQPAPTIKAIAT